MNTPNGPISKRKTVQLMVALTILAWATETLLHQWGYGAEINASAAGAAPATQPADMEATEKFVPADSRGFGATLELRGEATITGGDLKLKQVCRWNDTDNNTLAPLAELVIAHIDPAKPFKSISVNEIKTTLREAGVNLSGLNFVGTTMCTINRSDGQYDPHAGLQQWIDARSGDQPVDGQSAAPAAAPAAAPTAVMAAARTMAEPVASVSSDAKKPYHTLRELLTANIADHLNLPADSLQVDYLPLDEKVLNLCEPHFKFQIEPTRLRNLGPVEWDVTIITSNGNQKVSVTANARAWENQVILARPLQYHQLIQDSDVQEKRTLVDALPSDPLATKAQAVGEQAARDLKLGTVLDARMLDPVELIRNGQFVTITVSHGRVSIKTVARAMEGGTMGQTIKVKNETTHDIFDVVVTGPQQGSLDADAPASNAGNVALTN